MTQHLGVVRGKCLVDWGVSPLANIIHASHPTHPMTQHLEDVRGNQSACGSEVSRRATGSCCEASQSSQLGSIPAVQKLSTQEMENQFECPRLTNTFNSPEKWKSLQKPKANYFCIWRNNTEGFNTRPDNCVKGLYTRLARNVHSLTETEVCQSLPGPSYICPPFGAFSCCWCVRKFWKAQFEKQPRSNGLDIVHNVNASKGPHMKRNVRWDNGVW